MNEVEAFVKSPGESPPNAFKSLPKMSKVFVKFNTGVPAIAACERLFSVGKDVFSAKQSRLSDKNFERLIMYRVNKRVVVATSSFTSYACKVASPTLLITLHECVIVLT